MTVVCKTKQQIEQEARYEKINSEIQKLATLEEKEIRIKELRALKAAELEAELAKLDGKEVPKLETNYFRKLVKK